VPYRCLCVAALLPTVLLAQGVRLREVSGVARAGNELLLVDDAEVGAYFRVRIADEARRLIAINEAKPERMRLRRSALAVDLESVALLADGRVALLSERLRSLVGNEGILVEYDSQLAEVAQRGLEGLAVRPLEKGASQVAVLWEGGYPAPPAIPKLIQRPGVAVSSLPVVVAHELAAKARLGRLRWGSGVIATTLQVPVPEGAEPEAQRFRAPDLAWCRMPDGRWGFLVLLSSQNGVAAPEFRHRWLLRFDETGKAVGEPMDLAPHMPEELRPANWEGLDWFEPGRSVVLVNEGDGKVQPHALVVELPEGWRFGAK